MQAKPSSLDLPGKRSMPRPRARARHLFWLSAGAAFLLAMSRSAAAEFQAVSQKSGAAQIVRTDLYGDPLPPGAVARLGTLRDNIGDTSGDIVVSPDGKTITATTRGWWRIPLRLWDVATGRVVRHLNELEPPARYAGVRRVAFSHDGKLLATGDSAGAVRIGAADTGRKVRELTGPEAVSSLAFLPDNKCIAVAYAGGAIWLYRLPAGERVRSLALAPYYDTSFNIFSPDGKMVSVQRLDGSLSVRDVLTGREVRRLWKMPVPPRWTLRLGGQPLDFSLIDGRLRAFSPDGKLLAFIGRRYTVRLWNIAAGREVRYFPQGPLPKVRASGFDIDDSLEFHLAFSPDGKLLAAEQTRKNVCLWSVTTGQLYRRFPQLEIGNGIAFTADGKTLITGGDRFHYYDIMSGREIRRFPEQNAVHAIAFGRGGKTLATADGMTVRLWEAATGRELRQLQGHHAQIDELAFAPDGKIIVTGDDKGTIIVWDTTSGREVRRSENKMRLHRSLLRPTARPTQFPTNKAHNSGMRPPAAKSAACRRPAKLSGRSASPRTARPSLLRMGAQSGCATSRRDARGRPSIIPTG